MAVGHDQLEAQPQKAEAGAARARLATAVRWTRDIRPERTKDWTFTLRRLLAVGDALAFAAALAAAILVFGDHATDERFLVGLATVPAWIVLFRV